MLILRLGLAALVGTLGEGLLLDELKEVDVEHPGAFHDVGPVFFDEFLLQHLFYQLGGVGGDKVSQSAPGVDDAVALEVFVGAHYGVGGDGQGYRYLPYRGYPAVGTPFVGQYPFAKLVGNL